MLNRRKKYFYLFNLKQKAVNIFCQKQDHGCSASNIMPDRISLLLQFLRRELSIKDNCSNWWSMAINVLTEPVVSFYLTYRKWLFNWLGLLMSLMLSPFVPSFSHMMSWMRSWAELNQFLRNILPTLSWVFNFFAQQFNG